MKQHKFQTGIPLLMAAMVVIGMFFGFKMKENMPNSKFFTSNKANNNTLQQAIDIIEKNYVDSLQTDSLQIKAIQQIMAGLDPHSEYLPAQAFRQTTEDLSGNFQGIGVEYKIINDTINLAYILKDGPSDKAGLKIGDKIISIDDKTMAGTKLSNDVVKNAIRGEGNTKVNLSIIRNQQPLKIVVTRGSIPSPSVTAAYMMDKTIGYIKLDKFVETTYTEFMQALENLQKQGMQSLVFDLRGNGGGYMEKAIDIVDEFLDGDKLIVYTEGVNQAKKEYRAKRPGLFEKGKLTILVDEMSASASEIVCGAVQDWDRGAIIGRRTFGKGLVQENFRLSDGGAIKLTVARYYTPLGRSIQKPFSNGNKTAYMHEVIARYVDGEMLSADSNKVNNGKIFTTQSGKKLYGGGGIMPDYFVSIDTTKFSLDIQKILMRGSLHDFVYYFYIANKAVLDQYKTPQQFAAGFEPNQQMWPQLVQWAKKDTVNIGTTSLVERQKIEDRMEAYLARYKWRDTGFYEVNNTKDPVVLKAIEYLKK